MLSALLEAVFSGVSIGAVLLMAALGLAIVFGLMGVINMAHGELIMLGAYVTFLVQNGCKALGGPWFEFYIIPALILAFGVTAIAGLILERTVIRHLYGRPLETLLATWGVSLILQQFVRSVNWQLAIGLVLFSGLFWGGLAILARRPNYEQIRRWAIALLLPLSAGLAWAVGAFLGQAYAPAMVRPWFGAQNVAVTAPAWLLSGLPIADFRLPYYRIFIIVVTAICVAGIYWFLQRSRWGLRIRAVMQNRSMSACLGIPTQTVDALTFSLGSGLAGIAGCALSLLGPVGPNTGQSYIVDTFVVVVLGGVGKLMGTIVAAIAIGIVNQLISAGTLVAAFKPLGAVAGFFDVFDSPSMSKVFVFTLIVVFLQFRPAGFFPQKGRTVDA